MLHAGREKYANGGTQTALPYKQQYHPLLYHRDACGRNRCPWMWPPLHKFFLAFFGWDRSYHIPDFYKRRTEIAVDPTPATTYYSPMHAVAPRNQTGKMHPVFLGAKFFRLFPFEAFLAFFPRKKRALVDGFSGFIVQEKTKQRLQYDACMQPLPHNNKNSNIWNAVATETKRGILYGETTRSIWIS